MGYNHEFPYTDASKYNDDWLLNKIRELQSQLNEFINLNTIKYADPILWDITSQYEANTVVIDGQTGDAYISTKPVPTGVSLDNTDYWTQIYNYSNALDDIKEQIAAANEKLKKTASSNHYAGDLVWLNNELIVIIVDIVAGTEYVENYNYRKVTIEELIRVSYSSENHRLTLHAMVDANTPIVTHSDYHVYNKQRKAIEILEVE